MQELLFFYLHTQAVKYGIFCFFYFTLFAGTNVNEAKKTLRDSGLPIITANDLDEAARKAVMSIKT